MLAEPKHRTVWTLNPRGKYWAEDKNKRGQKLLESMGWREGQGLGKYGNGIKEHIKVGYKCDNKGLGFKPTADDQWIANNNTYEELLAELALHHNCGSDRESQVSDLELKSKQMRNRVHYQKFIKAKNLSQCSQKDLSSIFPKKSQNLNESKSLPKVEVQQSVVENEDSNLVTFESNKNMNDYFKSKMDKLKIKYQFLNKKDVTKSESEEVSQKYLGFQESGFQENGFQESGFQENCFISEEKAVISDDNCEHSLHKKLKKMNKLEKNRDLNLDLEENDLKIENCESLENAIKQKKKKRKKEKDLNNRLDTEIETNLSDESIAKHKKSKRKKKLCNEREMNEVSQLNQSQIQDREMASNEKAIENSSLNKCITKCGKNTKSKIRIPSGYEKTALSVSDSIKNYYKIYEFISKDKALNTTNLISLHGYGYETD